MIEIKPKKIIQTRKKDEMILWLKRNFRKYKVCKSCQTIFTGILYDEIKGDICEHCKEMLVSKLDQVNFEIKGGLKWKN